MINIKILYIFICLTIAYNYINNHNGIIIEKNISNIN